MDSTDVRWHQRYQNLGKALSWLKMALEEKDPGIVHRAGLIQLFEMSFELAWKTLKDLLQAQGFVDLRSPRDSIKKALKQG